MNAFAGVRIIIGCLFLISGLGKLLEPHQNFLYVIQSYEVLPGALETAASYIVPWVEFLAGVFLVLGLWINYVLRVFLILVASFLVIVSQALVRKLPITECGCFGELFSFPLPVVLTIDSILWILLALLLFRRGATEALSLDSFFKNKQSSNA